LLYWFPLIGTILALVTVWRMPKHITHKEIYLTWFIMSALTLYIDLFFGEILDLFDFVSPKITLVDLIFEALLAPAYGVIILNFLPQERWPFIGYLLGVVLFSVFFEWMAVIFDYLVYKGWKLWYSGIVYLCGVIYLRWHLQYLRSK